MPLTFLRNLGIVSAAGITTTKLGTGAVLQVVSTAYSTQTSTTGGFTDLGLSASITPNFSNSKIAIFASISGVYKNGSNCAIGLNVCRGASEIVRFSDNGLSYTGDTSASQTSGSICYLDSPATTSSTTYKIQFKNGSGTGTSVTINDGNVVSNLLLMEIKV